jgi:hypothetical protein
MHRISVRPPPPSASGRRRATAVAEGKVGGLPRLGPAVTPLALLRKTTHKTIHEHHIYLILHVIYCVDKVL